jgi:hypothetical protein
MPTNFLWDVFLSHSARDKERVRRLAESLRDAGLRIWLDEWVIQPGDDIYAAIEHGLEHTRTLILCMSQAAIDSDWTKLERNTIIFRDPQNKERRFIPLMLEDCRCSDVIRRLAHVDWRHENEETLAKLIQACQTVKKKTEPRSREGRTRRTPPTGAMRADDPLYVEREADVYAMLAAKQRAETVIIKAPRQMGKSSLLISYLAACRRTGKKTVLLDLASLFTNEEMADYPTFLTILAREIWDQLGQSSHAVPPNVRRQSEMTNYIERTLLRTVDGSVVVAFDEMDRMLGRASQADFFSMLRFWHNQRADSSTRWERFGLAIAISTEPYLFISDVMRSPFNVGLNIELRLFKETECQNLNRLYKARLKKDQLQRLMELLNGHPHLTHLAFYALTGPNAIDFSSFLQTASARNGPFSAHLRALEYKLVDEAGNRVLRAMKQIVNGGKVSRRDDFYRLHGAGLVREDGDRVVPSNELYARFFREL